MVPTTFKIDHYNTYGFQIEKIRTQGYECRKRVEMISAEMREKIEIDHEINECVVKMLHDLIENSDLPNARRQVTKDLKQVKIKNLECFHELLKARDGILENGEFVSLTKEKNKELMESFAQLIDEKITKVLSHIDSIDFSTTDLRSLERQMEQELETQLKIHETLLDHKTELAEIYLEHPLKTH